MANTLTVKLLGNSKSEGCKSNRYQFEAVFFINMVLNAAVPLTCVR